MRLRGSILDEEKSRLVKLLKECKVLDDARALHARVFANELNSTYMSNLVLGAYGRCGGVKEARSVFDSIQRNRFSLGAMLKAYILNNHLVDAKNLFYASENPDLLSCNTMIHALAYGGQLDEAKAVFDRIPAPDRVLWNTMMSSYSQHRRLKDVKACFDSMPERNVFSFNTLFVAYARTGHLDEAAAVVDKIPQMDTVSMTAILRAYSTVGDCRRAKVMFEKMPERDAVSWTTMFTAFADRGHFTGAKQIFEKMPMRDVVALNAMAAACRQRERSKDIFDSMVERNVSSWNTMVAGYAQHGHMDQAGQVFDRMPARDVISWNAMFAGHSHTGNPIHAIDLFRAMHLEGHIPDSISSLCVLAAAANAGGIELAGEFFRSMLGDYEIPWIKDHFCCMIGILSRAGLLRDAEELVKTMPFIPDSVAFHALLDGCRRSRDGHRAERVVRQTEVSESSADYVLISHMLRMNEQGIT